MNRQDFKVTAKFSTNQTIDIFEVIDITVHNYVQYYHIQKLGDNRLYCMAYFTGNKVTFQRTFFNKLAKVEFDLNDLKLIQ